MAAPKQKFQLCLALAAALAGADARAARPMVVDDARIVDAGACQLETWRRFNRDSQENWALPGCNPTGNIEFTLGSAELPVDDLGVRSYTRTVQMQGKTLFRQLETNGYSYGLAVGGIVRSRGAADQVPNYFAYMPFTRSLLDDRMFIHANLGVQRSGELPVNSLTWGIGTDRHHVRVFLMVETYGDKSSSQSYRRGAFWWCPIACKSTPPSHPGRRLRRQPLDIAGLRLLNPRVPEMRVWWSRTATAAMPDAHPYHTLVPDLYSMPSRAAVTAATAAISAEQLRESRVPGVVRR